MITASIVTYNTDIAELYKAVESLRRDAVDHLYIVDNSKSGRIREAVEQDSFITYIPNENTGYGAGHNVAIRKAIEINASYHLVLNSDVYWQEKVVQQLAEYLDMHPDTGQMMPLILYPDGSLQYQCKLLPSPADLLLKRFMPSAIKKRRMQKFQLEFTGYDHPMNVPYLSGCFMMLRVSAVKEVGLFDERFFMYPEDIDLTRRIHEKYTTLYYPFVSVTHIYAAESRRNLKLFFIHLSNMCRYFNKWGWFFDKKRKLYNDRLLQSEENLHR